MMSKHNTEPQPNETEKKVPEQRSKRQLYTRFAQLLGICIGLVSLGWFGSLVLPTEISEYIESALTGIAAIILFVGWWWLKRRN